MTRSRRLLLATIATFAATSSAPSAHAGAVPFSSGVMIASNSVSVDSECSILNVGKKAVTISSTAIYKNSNGSTNAPTFDTCTTTPLEPGTGCLFAANAGVFGGGTAIISKGSTKSLRGNCRLFSNGTVLQVLEMH